MRPDRNARLTRRPVIGGGLLPMLAAMTLGLSACQGAGPGPGVGHWRVEPVVGSGSAGLSAAQLYALGRYYHQRSRVGPAAEAYRQALARDPAYVEAWNALGALDCERGRIEECIATLEQALRLSPSAAHVQSNLGYALFLAGRFPEAVAALRRAVELDPDSAPAWANLSLALAGAGTGEGIEDARQRAIGPGAPAGVGAAERSDGIGTAIVIGADDSRGAEAVRIAAGAYQLRSLHAGAHDLPVTVAIPAPPSVPASHRTFRLEISNGNGTTAAARQVGDWLAREGAPVARLSNERPYNRLNTVVYFNRGYEAEARHLQQALGAGSSGPVADVLERADVRIAVGHDLLPALIARRGSRRPPEHVAG